MRSKFFIFFIFGFSISMVFWWFRDKTILGVGESGVSFYNIKRHLDISNYSWADPALGNSTGMTVVGKPTYWFLAKIKGLGIPSYIIQASFFWFLWFIAGVSVFLLIKEFFPKLEDKFTFLGVLFYWFNPISLVNVWNRFLYNYMVFWAYLPLALLLFIKGLKNKDFRFAILTSLSSVVFSFALTSIPFNLILWFLFFYTTLFYIFSKKDLWFILRYFSLTLISFVLFNFWWIGQALSYTGSSVASKAVSDFFTTEGNLANLATLSQLLGKFYDAVRLQHGTFFSVNTLSWAGIYNFPLVSVLGFFASILIFWSILKFKKSWGILFWGILFLTSLFLVKGNNPPFGEIFEFFFARFTVLQVFRNPFEKFGFLLSFSAAPLFALGVSKFSKAIKKEKLRRFFVGFTFFYVFVFLGFPFWTGLVFTRQDPITKKLESYEAKVPDYYEKVNNWFKKQGNNFRFVSLPIGGEGMTYTWEKPYSGVELSSTLFETPNISFNTSIPYYQDIVSELSKYQLSEKIFNFFPYLNAKYLLVRSDINFKERKVANPETVLERAKEWEEKGFVKKELEEGKLTVYRVDDKFFLPKVYIAKNAVITNFYDIPAHNQLLSVASNEKLVFIDDKRIDNACCIEKIIVKPYISVDVSNYYYQASSLSNDELVGRLFYAKYLPGDFIYPLSKLKENLELASIKSSTDKQVFKLGLLGKRLVALYRAKTELNDQERVRKAEEEYLNYFLDFRNDIFKSLEDPNLKATFSEFLIYNLVLLERLDSRTKGELSELLRESGNLVRNVDPHGDKLTLSRFNIPRGGKYGVLHPENVDWFILEGKKENSESSFDLQKGETEIIFGKSIEEKSVLLQTDSLSIENESLPSWIFYLPTVPSRIKISFDFRFDQGSSFLLRARQDIDREEDPNFKESIAKEGDFHSWRHWEKIFDTSAGAKTLRVEILPERKWVCIGESIFRKCNLKEGNLSAYLRNLRISLVLDRLQFLVSEGPLEKEDSQSNISFEKLNPTRYEVSINKESSNSEYLVFSELFSSGWVAIYENGEKIPEEKHFLANGYANAWIIDKPGNHQITIEYKPQEILEIGLKVSYTSIVFGVISVSFLTLFKKRYEKRD
jgi:hypothetical protein